VFFVAVFWRKLYSWWILEEKIARDWWSWSKKYSLLSNLGFSKLFKLKNQSGRTVHLFTLLKIVFWVCVGRGSILLWSENRWIFCAFVFLGASPCKIDVFCLNTFMLWEPENPKYSAHWRKIRFSFFDISQRLAFHRNIFRKLLICKFLVISSESQSIDSF